VLQFNKLHLSGFKSFVDQTDLVIELGLTGVVGPNGCGKSNLVEALRWVMGETSAKQMRGGEMDDVIFGGTTSRPPRNVAEVVLHLDNAARKAPAMFNDTDELEVSRRIEREKGSTYRVNGREVRARDVQLLFADSATGARSTALVSQGRIGAVINAKPTDRRGLLEEAAGITGLHSRRHEAELRLRGAETNLERLEDIVVTLEAQLAGLKKQARQANRYRNLSDHIRRAEATLFHLRWLDAERDMEATQSLLAEANSAVAQLTAVAAAATSHQVEKATALPDLRQAEAESAAELHRLTVARDGLDAEEQRINSAATAARERLHQISEDREREQALAQDADAAAKRLTEEQASIASSRKSEEAERKQAAVNLTEANDAVAARDAELGSLTERIATTEARRSSLGHRLRELEGRRDRLAARSKEIANERASLENDSPEDITLDAAAETVEEQRLALDAARATQAKAESAREASEKNARQAVAKLQQATGTMTSLEAEERTLADVLKAADDDLWPPLIDAVGVESGFEAALGAALGDDLTVPADEAAPAHWRTLAPLSATPSLPGGARALSELVNAPSALARRLSQIGVVENDADGQRLAADLAQGQRLVSREGSLWRWDGFTVSSGAATAAAARLEQRNRLDETRRQLDDCRGTVKTAQESHDEARNAETKAREAERAAREATAAAVDSLDKAREAQTAAMDQVSAHSSRLASLTDADQAVTLDREEAEAAFREADRELKNIADPAEDRAAADQLRSDLGERRTTQVECQSQHDNLERIAEQRRSRLEDIDTEIASWQQRGASAALQIEQLTERHETVTADLDGLSQRPAEIEEQRNALLGSIESSEKSRNLAGDSLAEAETALRQADQAQREAEMALAQAREEMVRMEGGLEQAKQARQAIAERARDRLDCNPDQLFEISGLKEDADLPELEAIERKVERLIRERDTMGPVNLRAETEAAEMSEQITTLGEEREDLLQAISKLRQGISELNREGRARLLTSFKEVDEHFQDLFVRLFGGGRAHLALTDSDDPLEAGLEIMASPPGKKLQVLSLLSGGEQALTALALLFGVFLTNPAPICVLDEVDAPLDDANVDRFCTLLEEMAHSQKTRFMIITHHRTTMARMDRLFGVTMSERGISQLVSVDLQRAEELRQTA